METVPCKFICTALKIILIGIGYMFMNAINLGPNHVHSKLDIMNLDIVNFVK